MSEEKPKNPFAVEPVDAIVFKKSSDAPELRAGASAAVRKTAPERVVVPVPEAPVKENFVSWIPGSVPVTGPTVVAGNEDEVVGDIVVKPLSHVWSPTKTIFTVLAVIIPVLAVGALVFFGLKLSGIL